MGLATSQARFLCITARKADCEYKSTELAQEKLEITNQLSDVAADYSNAMNSTMLIWENDATSKTAALSYGLLMTPSALNDYNPYMITSSSGAIVLNSEYAAAAKAAGISKAGGIGSQDSRDKFIAALVPGGIVTQDTANSITVNDYDYTPDATGGVGSFTTSKTAKGESVKWNSFAGMGAEPMNKSGSDAYMQLSDLINSETIGLKTIDWTTMFTTSGKISASEYEANVKEKESALEKAQKTGDKTEIKKAQNELDEYKKNNKDKVLKFGNGNTDESDDISKHFQTEKNEIKDSTSKNDINITVIDNGVINKDVNEIKEMTIGDLLSSDIVLMAQSDGNSEYKKSFTDSVKNLLKYIAEVFGYNQTTGTGLNVDEASETALEYAYNMVSRQFLGSTINTAGNKQSDNAMTDNSAYLAAEQYNRIGQDADGKYTAINLSNMVSAFLTYYDNSLNGTDTAYIVGKGQDTTSFVTDDRSYYYIGNFSTAAIGQDEKLADFFDELYNNICEKGWREDSLIDDDEYLASAIKDGRYSMSSLNEDGYYYQTRYNETGYLVEVTDEDAIAQAEAEYTRKKAELTYKEDSIDIKTKKLDTEISTLTTEYDTVKNLISKSIEKTFTMFSS